MEQDRYHRKSHNTQILDQSLNKTSFSVCDSSISKLPRIRQSSIKESVRSHYSQMRERVFSIQNHQQKEKKENVVFLTVNEVNELCANSLRYGIMQTQFQTQKKQTSFIANQDQKILSSSDTTQTKIYSPQYIPINNKFFCHFFDLMNEGKKRLYKERIKSSYDSFGSK